MNDYVLSLIFFLLAIGGIVVRKTYNHVPLHELKRRAEHGDRLAERIYPAVAYGSSLRVLLWLYIGLMSAACIILLARLLPIWASLLIVGPLLWIAFSWLPASRVSDIGSRLATLVTPAVTWLLNYLHPLLSRSSEVVQKRALQAPHTGLFERSDLIELIEQQQRQSDSRFTEQELEIARRALNFSEYTVSDVLVPRKSVKIVLAKDTIGPVLIDEMHKNGQGYALVRETPKGDFAGTLAFGALGLKSSGRVEDIMDPKVYYLHENDTLSQALHGFFTTNHPIFVVINSFQEFVGILTVSDILRQLLGHIPGDDFEDYHDPAVVAARHAKPEAASEKPAKPDKKGAEDKPPKDDKKDDSSKKDDKVEDTSVKSDKKVIK